MFDFDNPLAKKFTLCQDDFETLIAFFTPMEDIPIILNVSEGDVDSFCMQNYALPFRDAYIYLLAQARSCGRIMITKLANQGNNTAIGIFSKHLAKLEEDSTAKGDAIPIIAVIPLDNSVIDVDADNNEQKKG